MVGFTRDLIASLKRPLFIYLVSAAFTLILMFSFLFHLLEGTGVNPNIHEFLDSLYYSVTIMTSVGLGDITPVTRLGKTLSIVMMLAGTGLFVTFTGTLAASIIEVEVEHLKRRDD